MAPDESKGRGSGGSQSASAGSKGSEGGNGSDVFESSNSEGVASTPEEKQESHRADRERLIRESE